MKKSLKKNKDFKNVYEKRTSYATKNLVMYLSKNSGMERNRLGISVSHKVGNSVVRHTLVRRIREIYRKNEKELIKGFDIVIVLRIGSYEKEFFDLEKDFLYLCKKHGIVNRQEKE